jgi:RNA polymerase sigma-70 factor (ECF subfamily)
MGLSDSDKVIKNHSDLELVRLAVDEDLALAFEELMSRYYERTYAVLYRMVRDQDSAWDLTQETFLKAWRALSTYSGDAAFFTWIYRIARNLVSSEYRKLKARPKVVLSLGDRQSEDDKAGLDPESPDIGPDEKSYREERRQRILEAVRSLVPDFREIIVLRDLEKRSYDVIADLLEIPVGTVRSRLHRARLELKAKLADLFE